MLGIDGIARGFAVGVIGAAALALGAFTLTDARGPDTDERAQEPTPQVEWGIVVHGGAGTITRANMTPEMERAYREKMTEAIRAGHTILRDGGTSLDAIEATINILEDSELFNAGKGAVFTNSGANELDSSIMDGRTRNAGAIAGVKHVRNPISLARLVMERSAHVMLAREGAEEFALEQGIELVPSEYFFTERRRESLRRAQEAERDRASLEPSGTARLAAHTAEAEDLAWMPTEWKVGTVGAAALDRHGNLAAGTSTGGMTNKRWGRIGDSPVIGAGTYADNRSCAGSATGHGEFFIRNVVMHDICARMLYGGATLQEAGDAVIHGILVEQDATGGVIAIDKDGNIAMPFNTEGMYRGYAGEDGEVVVRIYRDEGGDE